MFFSPGHRIQKYLKQHPDTKTILVMGSRDATSAIRAITSILSTSFSVSIGINKNIKPGIVILDFKSMHNFPKIQPDFVALTSCKSLSELAKYRPWIDAAKYVLVNYNDTADEVRQELETHPGYSSYGDERPADYYFENQDFSIHGHKGVFIDAKDDRLPAFVHILGEHNLRPITLAAAIAHRFRVHRSDIIKAIESLRPLHGRMSPAVGPNGSIIIDDAANLSSNSIKNGLHTISMLSAPMRMLVIKDLRRKIPYDPDLIHHIVVIDPDISISENGIFHNFPTEVEAIKYIRESAEPDSVILLECPLPELITKYTLEED